MAMNVKVFFGVDVVGDGSATSIAIDLLKQPINIYSGVTPQSFPFQFVPEPVNVQNVSSTVGTISGSTVSGTALTFTYSSALSAGQAAQITGELLF